MAVDALRNHFIVRDIPDGAMLRGVSLIWEIQANGLLPMLRREGSGSNSEHLRRYSSSAQRGTWSSGDLETGVWTESGNPPGRDARKDYNFLPLSSITNIGQVTVTVRTSAYSSSGSDAIGEIRPFLEVWTKRKGKLLQQLDGSITPTGPDTFTFESTGPSGIVLGEGNQLRIMIRSLNRDKASGANDQVDIDLVEIQITPQP